MPIVARVNDGYMFPADQLMISIAYRTSDDIHGRTEQMLQAGDDNRFQWRQVTDEDRALAITQESAIKPTMIIDSECARALGEALVRHFGGIDDRRTLRRDFEHSEERRDLLEHSIIQIALNLSATPPPADLAKVHKFPYPE